MNHLKKDIFFYTIVFAVFYVLCSFNFMNGDDFAYSFKYFYTKSAQHEPITSLADVLDSQAYDYMTHGGRFIVHVIVQLFCGILGMELFRIFNSAVFVALCVGCVTLLRRWQGRKAADAVLVVFALFVLVPEVGYIFMGPIAMCVNYLWTACAVVWLLVIYDKVRQKERVSPIVGMALFLVALIVGSSQESFTIPLSGAMFFYYAFHLRKFRGPVVWLVLGLWLGTAVVTLAPGNFVRLEGETPAGMTLVGMVNRLRLCFWDMKAGQLLVVVLLGICLFNRQSLKAFAKRNIIPILMILVSLILVMRVYPSVRQITCFELFSIILLLRLLYDYCGKFLEKHRKVINASLCSILLLLCIPVYGYRRADCHAFDEMFNGDIQNGVLVASEYQKRVWNSKSDYLHHEYTCLYAFGVWNMEELSRIKTGGKNKNLIKAILLETPEALAEKYRHGAKNGAYHDKDGGYTIVKGKNGIMPKCTIEVRTKSILGQIMLNITGNNSNYLIDKSDETYPFFVGDTIYGIIYDLYFDRKLDIIACTVDGRTVQIGKDSQ